MKKTSFQEKSNNVTNRVLQLYYNIPWNTKILADELDT